jgi:hypothetical protein
LSPFVRRSWSRGSVCALLRSTVNGDKKIASA